MAKLHTFDAGSVSRIAKAVRWVEEFTSEDGIDLNAGSESTELTDIENLAEGAFAQLVSISDWPQGSTKSFSTTDGDGNSASVTASNPFGNAAAGTGVIINCGADGWVLIAATCKEDEEEST